MNAELTVYTEELKHLLDRLVQSLEGLTGEQLNWRPPAPETNSIFVIATHTMGNLEAWVLGIVCAQPIERDRPAEFASSGQDAAPLVARARELGRRFEEALATLSEPLDAMREPQQQHWGIGQTRPVSIREGFMHTIEHAAIHLGEIGVTRDLIRAGAAS